MGARGDWGKGEGGWALGETEEKGGKVGRSGSALHVAEESTRRGVHAAGLFLRTFRSSGMRKDMKM